MQSLPLVAAASGAVTPLNVPVIFAHLAEFSHRDEVRSLLRLYLCTLGVGHFLGIVWSWIASKIVVGNELATPKNALKLWGMNLLLMVGFVAFIFLIPAVAQGAGPAGLSLAICGGGLLALALVFVIPMKIYEIGFVAALVFLILSTVFSALGTGGVNMVLGKVLGASERRNVLAASLGKTSEERQAFTARLFGQEAPDEIDRLIDDTARPFGPKTLQDREAAVQIIQQKLESRRQALPLGNKDALAEFQTHLDRYLALLKEVKAERAAAGKEAVAH